ncbi:MAG TPA: flagellar filament capping protein FliD [Desulfobacteraceae bacterium]|nr:flagellar filament capping protein FliD [Desulfobacteraceae bacterium]
MAAGSISSLGIGSGLELQNILDQLKDVEKAPITAKKTEKTELQKEVSAFNNVKAKLFAIKSDSLSLSLKSDFLNNKISMSDEDIVSGRVDNGVAESSTTIDIQQKARANSWQSVGVASKSAVIYPEPDTAISSADSAIDPGSDTMTIQYGAAGDQKDITIDLDSEMSLTEVADTINASSNNLDKDNEQIVNAAVKKNSSGNFYIRVSSAAGGNSADSQISVEGFDFVKSDTTIALGKNGSSDPAFISLAPGTTYAETADAVNNASNNPGVTAAIIDDGSDETPYKLTITADATGEENRIEIQNLPMTEVTGKEGESLNARFTVNGIDYQRQSNDGIDDVITGATLNLKKTGEATVSVQHDMDSVKEHIQGMVKGFNALLSEIKGDENPSEEASETTDISVLDENYAVKQMMSSLHSLMGSRVDTGSEYSSLFDLGMAINKDGTISLDENTLDQALAANPQEVRKLFTGDSQEGVEGLGDVINDGITDMISTSGTITTEITANEKKLDRLDKDIETATERLNKRYETMTKQFAQLDIYIHRLNSESDYLGSMIDSFNDSDK